MRSLFPDECFQNVDYGNTKIHQLKSAEYNDEGEIVVKNKDAFLLTQWLERGVFAALGEQYLNSMIFSIFFTEPGSGKEILLENYEFKITYNDETSAKINGAPIISKDDVKLQATKFVRSLVEFSNTLDDLPPERWITMSLTVRILCLLLYAHSLLLRISTQRRPPVLMSQNFSRQATTNI